MVSFTNLNLSQPTLDAISEMGFEFATEIQSRAIPALMKNQDLIGLAGTGTGKTAAFAIPTIEKLDTNSKEVQALILCPTRELAVQVAEQFNLLMKHHKGLSCLAIYGGQSMYTQLKALQRKPQVIIGTPGRVMDHMRRGTLKLRNLKFLILDEADRMLDMGFEEAIETILEDTPAERQTVLFSATMQPEILKITQKYQRNAQHIDVTTGKVQSPQIEQSYYEIKNASKAQALKRLLAFHKIKSALVFTNTKRGADNLCEKLRKDGFAAAALHGDLRQSKRDTVMKGFRQDEVRLLIATDVAARGIDVENVDAVFNYDLPRDDQDYTHRIGRTGRAGKTGLAFSFIVGSERHHIERIARRNDNKMQGARIPAISEIELNSLDDWDQLITNSTLSNSTRKKYLKQIKDFQTEGLKTEEIPAALTKLVLTEPSHILGEDADFSADKSAGAGDNKRGARGGRGGFGGGRSAGGKPSFGGGGRSFGGAGGRSEGGKSRSGFGGKSSSRGKFGGSARSEGGKSSGFSGGKFSAARKPSTNQRRSTGK